MQAVSKRINVASVNQGRELTLKESMIAACRRLRFIERIQKDSFLGRKSIPIRREKTGRLVRVLSSEVTSITKYESTSTPTEEVERPLAREVISGPLVRPISREAPVPIKYESVPARAPRRRISSVQSYRIRTPLSTERPPQPTQNKSSETNLIAKWISPTPASKKARERMDQSAGSLLREFHRRIDSRPPDFGTATGPHEAAGSEREYEYETTSSGTLRKIKTHDPIAVRRVVPRRRSDLRNLGAKSEIFRVYSNEIVYKDADEEEAVRRMTEDL